MAQFRVKDTFEIADSGLFVMAGSVEKGEIKAGMRVCIPLSSGHLTAPIHSIEFARHREGNEDVCLCFELEQQKLAIWRGLHLKGTVLEVTLGDSSN